jgi:pimeloyl-ACP methyl ester carboxylesterase
MSQPTMTQPLPIVAVPGLMCTPRLYAEQIPVLWQFGPVTVADHRRDETMEAIAGRILATAPPRFALIGLSMGGYIAAEMLRQAPERVAKLALLDTSARADLADRREGRQALIAMAEQGRYAEVAEQHFPQFVHRNRHSDAALKQLVMLMAKETGSAAYVRQQKAIMARRDWRGLLGGIRCPTVVIVGEGDELTPPKLSEEIAAGIPDAPLVVVPDCGHLTTLESPEAVNAALAAWLS